MDHSQIITIEDIDVSGSLSRYDDVVDLEKDTDEFVDDDKCEIMEDEDGDHVQNDVLEIVGDDINEFSETSFLCRVFGTSEEAYVFYNDHAKGKGFGIRKQFFNKSARTQQIYRWRYVCSKEGIKKVNDKVVKRRRDTRTNCLAMLQIKLVDGVWKVEKFNDTHNHPLINTPSKVKKFSSQNELRRSKFTKSLVSMLSEEGLTSSKISKVVNAMDKEVNITPVQISTIISSQRKNNVGRECQGIIKHFQRKSVLDGSFYFDMHLAEDGTLRSVFWADGRSRAAYVQFGDVLVFDVSYQTNKFKFPFAPFVGVNHHGQSILFAAALLEDETEATFTWLFEQFLECMFDKSPIAIITDQDKAIGKAIAKIFPKARHRFCAWHMKKHVMEHTQALRSQFKESFDVDFRAWYKSRSIDEFEGSWESLKTKYDIKEGTWLANMYVSRHHWAKVYLKDTFWAGMTTSGRSESINAFFDGYVNSNTMLNDFVTQYDKAIKSRRDAEEDEDFKTRNTKAILETTHQIEAIAGERYTRKIFNIFKKEWMEAVLHYEHEKILMNEDLIRYKVGSHEVDKEWWAIVDYHLTETFTADCDHADTPTKEVSALFLWSLHSKCNMAISEARDCMSEIRKFDDFLADFIRQQLERKRNIIEDEAIPQVVPSLTPEILSQVSLINYVRDPMHPVKTKGRPKVASRLKSSIELISKQHKTCSYCGGKGHNKTSCEKRKMDIAREKQKEYKDNYLSENHSEYQFEYVEVLSDFDEDVGIKVAYVGKVKGFVSLFLQNVQYGVRLFCVPPNELYRFSHQIPSYKMAGDEREEKPTMRMEK
ncbi:protein FAR1-RELATED SEQUENCE 5-like [Gastrolobium bilobum]|uniref:protein FAR1-RELATED SEQUENCE 5-like n=1 Tax=Gastrolobium bilobum TaxID=150636 RepID=UPI002AAF7897|nr:protein FAR1-RELATED SEQUENCE 5-like [Gastrolobium bilobum]